MSPFPTNAIINKAVSVRNVDVLSLGNSCFETENRFTAEATQILYPLVQRAYVSGAVFN